MFSSIVVGIDGSDTAREAMRQATALALSVGARIDLVTGYEPVTDTRLREEIAVPQDLHWMVNPRDDAVATLDAAAAEIREAGVEVDVFVRQGDPADAILDVAEERGSDLIVVGNKGMTGVRRVLGSVPNSVAHQAPCSVLIAATT